MNELTSQSLGYNNATVAPEGNQRTLHCFDDLLALLGCCHGKHLACNSGARP